jgi:hypothetical protein
MRVIRTEMYFDASAVKSKQPQKNPGVAAAWFKTDAELSAHDISTLLSDRYFKIMPKDTSLVVKIFADVAVQGIRSPEADVPLASAKWSVANGRIVDLVLHSDIVYEDSPPEVMKLFSAIAKAGASVVIGTFLGYEVADENYPLMFITIPTGIIVIGATLGVSRGLENGLNKYIENLFKTKDKNGKKKK